MHKLLLPTFVLALLFLVLAAARPQEPTGNETKLSLVMARMRTETKTLDKALAAKDGAAAWTSVCAIQGCLLEAKREAPASTETLPAADRPGYVNAFRAKVSGALKTSCELESAVLAGRFDDAGKTLKELVGPIQGEGHREFQKE